MTLLSDTIAHTPSLDEKYNQPSVPATGHTIDGCIRAGRALMSVDSKRDYGRGGARDFADCCEMNEGTTVPTDSRNATN
jgi:hypothetical protein